VYPVVPGNVPGTPYFLLDAIRLGAVYLYKAGCNQRGSAALSLGAQISLKSFDQAVFPGHILRIPEAAHSQPTSVPPQPQRRWWLFVVTFLAVLLTTYGLLVLNRVVSAQEPHIYVRPYTGLYILTVLMMTWIGGRRWGIFTLGICLMVSMYYLLPPRGWQVEHPSDVMGIVLLSINSIVVVYGFDGLRQKTRLIAAATAARELTMRQSEEIALSQTRLQSVIESAQKQRHRSVLQHMLSELPEYIAGLDLRVHFETHPEAEVSSTPFFDGFPVHENTTALVIGAVGRSDARKGETVMMLRHMLRSAVYRCDKLADAVTELNELLVSRSLLTAPSHLLVCYYDAASATLTSVSCGDMHALARRFKTGQVETLSKPSPLLGMAAGTVYQAMTVNLSVGDLLLLSPGIDGIDHRRREEALWAKTLQFSAATLDAAQLIRHLVRTAREWLLTEEDRNLCLMAARVTQAINSEDLSE